MEDINNSEVAKVFSQYPELVRTKLLALRTLVLETVRESNEISAVEETLKWGEPSFVTKTGSTIRIDWKQSRPDHYALYFNCKTTLIDTFKEFYRDQLNFEGNRAIIFDLNNSVPVEIVKHCIFLALTYHKRKHLPLLGVTG